MIAEIRKTADGAALLRDWLGDGLTPVDEVTALNRASICAKCPKNIAQDWWTHAVGLVADAIKKQMALKHQISAVTPYDEKIGTCGVCICNLGLKVWCPDSHIRNHTDSSRINEYPAQCWIKPILQ